MKKIFSVVLSLIMVLSVLQPSAINAFASDGTSINEETFPDAQFRNYVKENFDTDGNGSLSAEELDAVTKINLGSRLGITSLKGIEYFTSLLSLVCSDNKITELNLDKNTALETLVIVYNLLTELDVSNNTALKNLQCYHNQITKLDISKNTALEYFDCSENRLTSLDTENNKALKYLCCTENQISSIDIAKNTKLIEFMCGGNPITQLDISNNTALKEFECANTLINGIDVSKNTALEGIYCAGNNLTSLDVSNNAELDEIDCNSNRLTALDLSNNKKLTRLNISHNLFESIDVSKNPELLILFCENNRLSELDVSKNKNLYSLYCGKNRLASLDFSGFDKIFISSDGNKYPVDFNEDGTFDLSSLPGGFDVSRASGWIGAAVKGNILTVNKYAAEVSYNYDLGNGMTAVFRLAENGFSGIEIDENHFPDVNFRQYIEKNFDRDCDGRLTAEEMEAVKKIDVTYKNIASLKGIEYFLLLRDLNCGNNKLTSLDVSNNTELRYLACYKNSITELDVSKNTKLYYLYCSENRLTSLDLSNNTAIIDSECNSNYDIQLDENGSFNLSSLPGGFDVSRASGWSGGNVKGNMLTVDSGAEEVTYEYDLGNGKTALFALTVKNSDENEFLGDLNGDGAITSNDYAIIYEYVTCNVSLTKEQKLLADVNKDGAVDGFDVIAVDIYLNSSAGK